LTRLMPADKDLIFVDLERMVDVLRRLTAG
jgi:hypothetical protein